MNSKHNILAFLVGKGPIKEKEDANACGPLQKLCFCTSYTRHKQSHALTYYALAYYYIPFTFKANKGCVTLYGLAIYIKK